MLKHAVMTLPLVFVLFFSMPCVVLAASLNGTYTLVGDSDATTLKKGAVVTITFKGASSGTLSMKAVQPGETVVGTGTSTWIRKDPACSRDIATQKQALSDPSAGTAASSDEKAPSKGGDPGPLAGLEGKESCEQCKYIPCIKSLIEQKEAFVKALKAIAAERGWGSLGDAQQEGRDYADIAPMSRQASDDTVNTLNEERGALLSDLRRHIDPERMTRVKKDCPFSGGGVIMMTDSTFCNIDQQSVDSAIKAIPCAEIARYMYDHESYHFTQCLERLRKKMVAILTARGEAREDAAAYTQETRQLKDLLARASRSSKGGCWRCGKTQVVYPSAKECDQKCEEVRLGGSIMFKCWKLNEKGEHILTPGGRF